MEKITTEHALRGLAQETIRIVTTALAEHRLNINQYAMLSAVADYGPINTHAAANIASVNDVTAQHAVAVLRGRGLIIRDENRQRRYAMPLLITQTGLLTLEAAKKSVHKASAELDRFINAETADGIITAYIALRDWYELPL